MSNSGRCVRLVGLVGAALRALRDSLSRRLPLHSSPSLSRLEFFDALCAAEANEQRFLALVLHPLDDSVFDRLLLLEGFLDQGRFWEAVAAISREDVDRGVSYELQNVRAYLYYLSLKARLRAYQASFRFEELVDRSSFAFSPETVVAHVRESSRLMTQVAHFLVYSQASVHKDLTRSILRLRVLAFFELEFDCFALLLFMLVFHDTFRAAAPSKDVISALKYFTLALDAWSAASKSLPLVFEERNVPKAIGDTLIGRVTELFEQIFFFRHTDPRNIGLLLRGTQECAALLMGREPESRDSLDWQDYTHETRNKRAHFLTQLQNTATEKIVGLRLGWAETQTPAESNFRRLVHKVAKPKTASQGDGKGRSRTASPHCADGGELRAFMNRNSIILRRKDS